MKLQFPVVYGIRVTRSGVTKQVISDIKGEVDLVDGAKANEIKTIFVEPERIEYVSELLKRYGHNIPVSSINILTKIVGFLYIFCIEIF